MEIVIDIPEEEYALCKRQWDTECLDTLMIAVKNGTPLPKGHGRLIEAKPIHDELMRSYRASEKDYPELGKDYRVGLSNAMDLLNNAPTIIDADKESE